MADKPDAIFQKCCIAKDMIGMAVRIYDEADWLFRMRSNSREQLLALAHAPSRIDHRDRLAADDEAEIGDGALIFPRHQCRCPQVYKESGCDLADRKGALPLLRQNWPGEHCDRSKHK